jgi:hypothetical protein
MAKRKFLIISATCFVCILCLQVGIKRYQAYRIATDICACIGIDIDINFEKGSSDVAGFGEGCLLYVFSYKEHEDISLSIKTISVNVQLPISFTSYNSKLNKLSHELYTKYKNENVVLIYKSGDEINGELIFADKISQLIYYLDYSY